MRKPPVIQGQWVYVQAPQRRGWRSTAKLLVLGFFGFFIFVAVVGTWVGNEQQRQQASAPKVGTPKVMAPRGITPRVRDSLPTVVKSNRFGPASQIDTSNVPEIEIGPVILNAARIPESRITAMHNALHEDINILYDKSLTFAYVGPNKNGGLGLFAVSSDTIFDDDLKRMQWSLVALAAAGSVMNKNSDLRFTDMMLSDRQLAARRLAYVIDADLVKSVQRDFVDKKSDLSLEDGYRRLLDGLRLRRIPHQIPESLIRSTQ